MTTLAIPKGKKVSLKKLKKRAWDMCSKFIRLSSADEDGYVYCYTCGKRAKWNDGMQAGHGIAGRNNAVLFMVEVIRPQCVGCNYFGKGQTKKFTERLIEDSGEERYEELLHQAQQPLKRTAQDYIDLYEEYKDLLAELDTREQLKNKY
jgi:hypothetical protein